VSAPGLAPPGAAVATSAQYGVADQTDAFVVGRNGAVDLLWDNGAGGWHSAPVSAPRFAPPGAAVATSAQYGVADQTDAFVVGRNGAVSVLWARGDGRWHRAPVSAPGLAAPGAAVATSAQYGVAGQTDAFVVGADGAVSLLWARGDGGWHSAPVSAPGLALPGTAVAASPQYGLANRTDAFVAGADGAVSLLSAGSEGTWRSAPVSAPRSAPAGAPVATAPAGGVANRTDVFVKGAHGALTLYWATSRGTWHRKPL
jgi:hypothetical protein